MARVDGDTVIVAGTTFAHVLPVSVLLFEVETGRIGDERLGEDPPGETEPADDPEACTAGVVVEQDGGDEGAELARGGGETVGGGADRDGVDFGGEQEGGAATSQLVSSVWGGGGRTWDQTAGRRMRGSRWLGSP